MTLQRKATEIQLNNPSTKMLKLLNSKIKLLQIVNNPSTKFFKIHSIQK